MSVTVKTTERGWCAHFICCRDCLFRRNTLVDVGHMKFVVSTVGNYRRRLSGGALSEMEEIGLDRHYETYIFKAKRDGKYVEADISRQVYVDGAPWSLKLTKQNKGNIDNLANEMHDNMVAALIEQELE